jgi:hypothetical protein
MAARHPRSTSGAARLAPWDLRFWRILAAEVRWLAGPVTPVFEPAWCVRESLSANPEPTWFRQEIVAALTPVLRLTPSTGRLQPQVVGDQLSDLAAPEIDFADGQNARLMIESINGRPDAAAVWAGMLEELTSLLRRALDLYAVADQANEAFDPSAFHRPSIVPHGQNFTHRRWTLLFDLIWHGWTHIDAANAEQSRAYVAYWRQQHYLAFRRLVLAAMNHSAHFGVEERRQALFDA